MGGREKTPADTLRRLRQGLEETAESLQRALDLNRAASARLKVAAETGDLEALITDPQTADDVVTALIPHLGVSEIRALMLRPRTGVADDVVRSRIQTAALEQQPIARELVTAVATTPVWSSLHRVQALIRRQPTTVIQLVASVAAADPRLSVLFGFHLDSSLRLDAPEAQVRRWLLAGRHADLFRLGRSFRGGMRDAALEWELVELLATMPAPDVAARLAEQMPPLTTDSAAAVAQRLADLDALVTAVTEDAPTGH